MQVWNVLHAARCKCRTQKSRQKSPSRHHRTTLSGCIFAIKAYIDNQKNLLSSNIFSICPHSMLNFGLLAAEIGPVVWGTPANFNGFFVLAALLHGTLVVGISQTLRRWTEGATYIRQGGYHVGHWPTFWLLWFFCRFLIHNFAVCEFMSCFHCRDVHVVQKIACICILNVGKFVLWNLTLCVGALWWWKEKPNTGMQLQRRPGLCAWLFMLITGRSNCWQPQVTLGNSYCY